MGREYPEYAVRRVVIGSRCALDLSEAQVNQLRAGISDIREMFDLEQKFDMLLANLLELEKEMAALALENTFYSDFSTASWLEQNLTLNRRVMNVLTAARLYIDQAPHHLLTFFPDAPERRDEVASAFSAEYDAHLGYRAMEALRNYAQHRALPVHGVTQSHRWIDRGSANARMEANVGLKLEPSRLAEDGKFKMSVLKELSALGDSVDIKPMLRQYVESLGRVHASFREALGARIMSARADVEAAISDFRALEDASGGREGLGIVRNLDEGRDEVLDYLPTYAMQCLDILQARSRVLAKLSRRTISTDVIRPR